MTLTKAGPRPARLPEAHPRSYVLNGSGIRERGATTRGRGKAGDRPTTARAEPTRLESDTCWLCGRALGRRMEWHHPTPKSRGGRMTVPVHAICHRTIHACFSNVQLARMSARGMSLAEQPDMRAFLTWIANKPPDFHAPTRGRRSG